MRIHFAFLAYPFICKSEPFGRKDFELDKTILRDLMYPSSPKCINNDSDNKNYTTTYTYQFNASDTSRRKWSNINAHKEHYNFLAQMHHEDLDPNRTWTILFGKGGSIYSLFGKYGEAMPPQTRGDSPWIDEVIQGVGVDLNRNRPQDGKDYFIHQAGVYSRDPPYVTEEEPFYSPIVGKHCFNNTCIFLSWGQQAHVPTVFKSDLLYLYQYSDCGNGVIEFSQMFINVADIYGDSINYLNIPWGGVRRSTFREVLLSDIDGKMLPRDNPLQRFSDEAGKMPPLHQTGGYTTFAQNLTPKSNFPINLPCAIPNDGEVTSNIKKVCTQNEIESKGFVRLKLVIQSNNACTNAVRMSKKYRDNIVACKTHNIQRFPMIRSCNLCKSDINIIVQQRNATIVSSKGIILLSQHGHLTYFRSSKTSDELNKIWKKGDQLQIYPVVNTKNPYEENLALCFVHGTDDEYYDTGNTWYTAPTRIRYGQAGRDFNVFTINSRLRIRPGQAYVSRQFLINAPLRKIEEEVTQWVDETVNDFLETENFFGRSLVIYSSDNSTYGITAAAVPGEETTSCSKGVRRCSGSSVPRKGMVPYFSIKCGNMTYFGPDRYYFGAPENVTDTSLAADPVRSYACNGLGYIERPMWRFMGFYQADNGCEFLRNASYDEGFCLSTSSPLPQSSFTPKIDSMWNTVVKYDHWAGTIIDGM